MTDARKVSSTSEKYLSNPICQKGVQIANLAARGRAFLPKVPESGRPIRQLPNWAITLFGLVWHMETKYTALEEQSWHFDSNNLLIISICSPDNNTMNHPLSTVGL